MAAPRGPRGERPRTNAGDRTGLQNQALEAEAEETAAQEAARRQAEEDAEAKRREKEVIDYTNFEAIVEVEENEVEDTNPFRTVRMKFAVEDMVYGRKVKIEEVPTELRESMGGRTEILVPGKLNDNINLEEGRKYKLPRDLADHLDERGYIL
jgi:hypothetical protein